VRVVNRAVGRVARGGRRAGKVVVPVVGSRAAARREGKEEVRVTAVNRAAAARVVEEVRAEVEASDRVAGQAGLVNVRADREVARGERLELSTQLLS
jgi:hypothetical protein